MLQTAFSAVSNFFNSAGIWAILKMIYIIEQHYQITKGGIEVGCDGEEALVSIMDDTRDINPNTPERQR